jgi:hypothetical protein
MSNLPPQGIYFCLCEIYSALEYNSAGGDLGTNLPLGIGELEGYLDYSGAYKNQ